MNIQTCLGLLATTILASSACSSEQLDDSKDGFNSGKADSLDGEQSRVGLSIRSTWTLGEMGDEESLLGSRISFDEESEEFVSEEIVEFGPLSECTKPSSERASGSLCHWSGPSEHWNLSVNLNRKGVLDISVFSGDVDTDGGSSLPLASVPQAMPWTFAFSPDNAAGSVGSISVAVQRIAPEQKGSLGCEELAFENVDDLIDDGEFDSYVDCWLESTICWDGNKDEAASMLSDLFDEAWSETRSFDDLNAEGPEIRLFSTHVDDGTEEEFVVPACN